MTETRGHTADDGFTLVELLVVIMIVGILSAIAVPTFAAQTGRAKQAAMKTALRNAATAEEALATDGLPYVAPGVAAVDVLRSEGYKDTSGVVLTVVDNDMADAGHGFCLMAASTSMDPGNELYYANSGPDAGHATPTPCVAS